MDAALLDTDMLNEVFKQREKLRGHTQIEILRRHAFLDELACINFAAIADGAVTDHRSTLVFFDSSPSLSQHVGHVSSIWTGSKAFINRSAAAFAGSCIPADTKHGTAALGSWSGKA